ncbi:SRPBCC domain-containing protein [Sphingomonas psychrotolerans]|uniref:SRPBCC domain-containing protein n=1 Tax=Sphingomonas psychrotolerans TaxID=1327635 RepID=A0A2K8MEB4_9SPHN|nr:SRPBCC domain-containing protein [Sphingomonas psychrotolerans]ATY32232.1 SRPBCC domain-containing protein [Sphingomonas psychrotolerans]
MNAIVTESGVGSELVIVRTFAAPRDLVFDCLTKAEHLARWWGPHHFDVPFCESDVRPGGKIRIDMRGPEPHGTNPCFGEFLEVERPDRLSIMLRAFQEADGSWGIEHVTTFVFEDAAGGGTTMHMTTVIKQVSEKLLPALSGMEEGWSQSFEKLEALLPELV